MKNLNSLQIAILKMFLFLTILFSITVASGQNNPDSLNVEIDGVEFINGSKSFNNVFELKIKRNKKTIDFKQFSHVFKVVKCFNNKTIVKVVNNSYYNAKNVKNYIRENNKNHNIIFVR